MASNLLELRRAAGYRNASDFAEEHGIPASTYARYESNPGKIPMERAWQLADILGTSIDAVVGRDAPDPASARGEVQIEYDGLTPEARALADEFREFVRAKDAKIKARRRRDDERRYEALCYQYEQQMLSGMREGASFGELVGFGSAAEARDAFESYLQAQAAEKRGELSAEDQKAIDDQTIAKIMAAYDRAHGEFEFDGMSVIWNAIDHALAAERGFDDMQGDGLKA